MSSNHAPPPHLSKDPTPSAHSDESHSAKENARKLHNRIEHAVFPMLRRLHARPSNEIKKLVLFATGAGSAVIPWLFSQPGASRHVLDVRVPYDTHASGRLTIPMHSLAFRDVHFERVEHHINENKGNEVEKHERFPENSASMVSFHQARYLAMAAYREALTLLGATSLQKQFEANCYGVGCTAAISTWKDRRGTNHAYISSWNGSSGRVQYVRLRKVDTERTKEEAIISDYLVRSIAKEQDMEYEVHRELADIMEEDVEWKVRAYDNEERLTQFLTQSENDLSEFLMVSGGRYYGPQDVVLNQGARILLCSGSFNPLHKGHKRLAQIALQAANAQLSQDDQERNPFELVYEIAVKNADKDAIAMEEIRTRLEQFQFANVCLTKAPLFLQKARLFSGCAFVVGYDTIVRILDKKYYNNSMAQLIEALVEMIQCNVQFIVVGRLDKETNTFKTLRDVNIPEGFEKMFVDIPEEWFREDISSTEIREQRRAKDAIVSSGAGEEGKGSSRMRRCEVTQI